MHAIANQTPKNRIPARERSRQASALALSSGGGVGRRHNIDAKKQTTPIPVAMANGSPELRRSH